MANVRDLPGGPMDKNLPSNAGNAGSIPSPGTRIPRALGPLSPHAQLRYWALQLRPDTVKNKYKTFFKKEGKENNLPKSHPLLVKYNCTIKIQLYKEILCSH